MRPHFEFQLVAILFLSLAGCSSSNASSAASPSPTPLPLASCETRSLTVEGVNVVVQASVDAKPSKIDIDTGDAQQRDKIRAQVVAVFGDPHPDTRTVQRPYKWGLIQVTDLCGRVVSPSPSAPPG